MTTFDLTPEGLRVLASTMQHGPQAVAWCVCGPCLACERTVTILTALVAEASRARREFKTHDHSAANGRVPVADDTEWKFTFPLEGSSILSVRVARRRRRRD